MMIVGRKVYRNFFISVSSIYSINLQIATPTTLFFILIPLKMLQCQDYG